MKIGALASIVLALTAASCGEEAEPQAQLPKPKTPAESLVLPERECLVEHEWKDTPSGSIRCRKCGMYDERVGTPAHF